MQQARARHRLPGARGRAPQPRDPRPLASTASPRTRRTWRSRWPRSTRPCTCSAPTASARSRSPDLHRLPGDKPAARHRARARRADHRVELPPLPRGRARATARSATARRSRSRSSRSPPRSSSTDGAIDATAGSRSAASPTCRGARERAEAALRGRAPTAEALRRGRRRRARGRASRCATTPSRCRWPATCSSGRCSELTRVSRHDASAVGTAARAASTAAPRSPARRATRSSTESSGVAYAGLVPVDDRRAARSTRIDAERGARRCPASSPCITHDNAPRLGEPADARAARSSSRHRSPTAARSSPPWSPRRSSRRARPPPLVAVDYDAARPRRRAPRRPPARSTRPTTVNPSFPDRHRRRATRTAALRRRGGHGRRDLRDARAAQQPDGAARHDRASGRTAT